MAFSPSTGHGATLGFSVGTTATNWASIEYISIGASEQTRDSLTTSHLGTTDYHTKIPGDLVDAGGFDCEFYYNPLLVEPDTLNLPAITTTAQTITLTLPKTGTTTGSAATIAGTGFVTSFSTPDMTTGDLMTGSLHVDWADGPVFAEETEA